MTPDTRPPALASIGVGALLGSVIALAAIWLGTEYGAWWGLAGSLR